jgi:hypothetical protein
MKCFLKGKERLLCSGTISTPHEPLKLCRGFYYRLKNSEKVYKREFPTALWGRERPVEAISLHMDGKTSCNQTPPCSLIGNQMELTGAVLLKVTNNF